MKRSFIILMALLCALPGVCQQLSSSSNFTISLTANKVAPGTKLYLLYQTDGSKFVDSAMLIKGCYHLSGNITKPIRATMVLDIHNKGLQTLLRKRQLTSDVLQFYIHPGIIKATIGNTLAETTFIQSNINKDFAILKASLKTIFDREKEISSRLVAEQDTAKLKPLEKTYDSLKIVRMPILKAFITGHPNSYISLVALQEYYSRLQAADNYNLTQAHLNESKSMFSNLAASVQNTTDGKQFARQFANVTRLAEGTVAPEFSQPDENGFQVRLSSYRGKYVLLNFWASWCGPCRQESPQLVKLYNQFSSKNFAILGISLDDKEGRKAWLNAIKVDGLQWTQVSDLKHWDNDVVKLYSIAAIPQNILIDPDGRIIANGISVEDLRIKLNQLLLAK
ncbi:AhpC/TSA family protein [Mucilaginibacter terrenus]|uniref:AhpC/TSA family protein n=1 Tax=Mucilaginibacter terrenus TaxID=2482727 RepID=A0A3E2NMX2_9SPHI|nr:TlpA disulfide reductase family protein [Mucilaginibacter terrenus]RFZ82345.1 AhpC/TSA family protein [Mucilaginibacter terrenus]